MLFSKKQLFSLVVLVCVTFLATLIPSQVVLASPQGLTIPLPKFYQSLNTDLASINLKGIRVYPHKPFYFDLIVDAARPLAQNQQQTKKLANYFLAAVAIPKESMWVNLSPYEKNRIVDENLGITDLGKDLLAQDYVLKQLTSAMLNPNEPLGKDFWKRVYQKTQSQYGSTQVTLNTLNKVWIVPQKAVVYQHGLNAFVVEAKLKVMLEEDYLACVKTKDQRPNVEYLYIANPKVSGHRELIIRSLIYPSPF